MLMVIISENQTKNEALPQQMRVVLGNADLQTTMIYIHILKQGGQGVVLPLDKL